jgi:ubiquinone/menaquinone biosynthesis C-methylase UbiE/acyl carrier protein
MVQTGSYDVKQFSTTSEGEIRRLDAQLDLFWKKEYSLYTRAGLTDGMNILDAGCGPGYLAEKMLTIFPSVLVTAVEIDPVLIDVAQKRLNAYCTDGRCSIIQNSILQIDCPDNSFDFIISRLVIEHVPDPDAACRELLRVLKPGGTLVLIDNDFEMHIRTTPPIQELSDLYDAYCRARFDEGGNPRIGRELPLLLRRSGFTDIDLEIICAHNSVVGDIPFLKSEGPGIPVQLINKGYLSDDTYKKLTVKWHDMLKKSEHAIVRQLYAAISKKSAEYVDSSTTAADLSVKSTEPFTSCVPGSGDTSRDTFTSDAGLEKIISLVTQHVSQLLNSDPSIPINNTVALSDLGIDSEMATELQQSLSNSLKLKKTLPATLVFDYPTICSIARFIDEQINPKSSLPLITPHYEPSKPLQVDPAGKSPDIPDDEIERRLREKLDFLDKDTENV